MSEALELEGEVTERQSFLNGTRYLLIEAGGDGWTAQLALTLPREEGQALSEGDISLGAGARSWQGVLTGGSHRGVWDDSLDVAALELHAECTRALDADLGEPWGSASIHARMVGDAVTLRIEPRTE